MWCSEVAECVERAGTVAGRDTSSRECAEVEQTEFASVLARVEHIRERVDKLGTNDPDFDTKIFTDEMWDGQVSH